MHLDQKADILSFPTIYCGKDRVFKKEMRITYTDIAKSLARNYDRRACKPTHIFYMFKRSFNEKVYSAMQICLRKKTGKTPLTASMLKSKDQMQELLDHDDGYKVFKNLRSSPCYWKAKQKKVMGMHRQLGKAGFFITLSAAETKWTELTIMLTKLLKGEIITEEDAGKLSFEDKAELIRQDPVTCMRHFDHRYRALLNILFKNAGGIFSPYRLVDYFSRIEYQMRGSPHSHGLYWIEDSPIYKEGTSKSVLRKNVSVF